MVSPTGWHEFEQTLGDSEGQGSLEGCSPQGCRVGHNLATEQQQHNRLKKNENILYSTGNFT